MPSLRRRVTSWLLPSLVVVLAVNAVLSYRGALEAANLAYDRSLWASIKSIGENSYIKDDRIRVDIPYSALEVFSEGAQERVFYAVIGPEGKLLTGYPHMPVPQPVPGDGVLKTTDAIYNGEAVRIGVMRKRLYDPAVSGDDDILILVAETTETRTELAWRLFFGSLSRQLALIGLGSLLVIVALGTAFRPLLRLRDTIRQRNDEDLTPVSPEDVPSEIRPLIDAINHHMGRISAMLEIRKRFIADAAHQLRTPLTVLGTQAEYGLRQDDPAEMRRTLEGIAHSVRSAQRLTNQMLSLSKAEAANGLGDERKRLDLTALVREVAMELGPLALRKQIDLAYEGDKGGIFVDGNETMLRELFSNLVDNAIRYTLSHGQVTVAAVTDGAEAVTVLSDSGPGIPLTERSQVFRRFYRSLDRGETEGSGLGLAIVSEICAVHGGSVALDDGPGGRGVAVSVRLPLARAA
ncbi:MAG: sensor histidine kinase N-terminal domain-containing protein [Proteobacteria bacterium]|nr:sensor histidine kinase N-terminal domain-containing protein [Pseudomonadota bacterium]